MKHLRGAAGIILSLIFAVCFMCSPAVSYTHLDVYKRQDQLHMDAKNHGALAEGIAEVVKGYFEP